MDIVTDSFTWVENNKQILVSYEVTTDLHP